MKTLVIHPRDVTTDFLSAIYEDKDWHVIDSNVSSKELKHQIKMHDRIVMLGHGSGDGLFGYNKFVIDSKLVYLLRHKLTVCIWCNADVFVKKYGLNGFYTGMIVSEIEEAYMYSLNVFYSEIGVSNMLFADAVKKGIDEPNMAKVVLESYTGTSAVIEFNRSNIYQCVN